MKFTARDERFQFEGKLDLLGNPIAGVDDPTDPQDAATKAYVDAAVAGVSGVTSVNGDAGPAVVLDAADVGADATGTAAAAIATHVGLSDPHTQYALESALAAVATSGAYSDLTGKPTLGTAAPLDVDTDGALSANSDTKVPSQKAVRTYVDTLSAGLRWKAPCRVATTANGTLSTAYANGQTVDGVTLVTGDRILIKDQTTGSQNGIYVVAASGAPTRATDADSAVELDGAAVFVTQGSTNADKAFVQTADSITVGTTALVWTQFTAVTSAITLTGDVTGSGSSSFATTIANDAVTNAKLANMANATIKGRTTAGTGDPEDLTAAQVRAILSLATVATSASAADLTTGLLTAARIAGVVVPASFASSGFAKVRARMSTNQSVSAATATTIQFNTVDADTDGLFNNGVYTFSPAVSGDYDITLTVEISANDRMILMVWDTAAEVKRVFDLASGQCVTVEFEIPLTTGNAYRFRLQTGGAATIVSGAAHTTVSIRRKP